MGKKLIVITGQTATGKTALALNMASLLHGNLINADSRQIYRGLTIISGKDVEDYHFHTKYKAGDKTIGYYTLKNIPVWLYDIIDPRQSFSSHEYVILATSLIAKLLKKDITPIVVGGTYLYLYHLLYGLDEAGDINSELREQLNSKSVTELQHLLIDKDNEMFNKLNHSDQNNPHRLIRKLEQLEAGIKITGMSQTYMFKLSSVLHIPDLEIEMYGTYTEDKDVLKERIRRRVVQRIEGGALEEVQKILSSGCKENEPGLKTLGFSLLSDYIRNNISKDTLIEQWTTKELQYAKRQYTFMKRDPNIKWISPA
jgi:tRNA dimethylallyltransferase